MQKTMAYPQPPSSAGNRPSAPATMRPPKDGSQAAAGARARAMKRDTVRKNGGGPPYDCG